MLTDRYFYSIKFYTILFCFFLLYGQYTYALDIKKYIQDRIASGEKYIKIPQGVYVFDLADYKPLLIENKVDITIDGNGSEFICNRNSRVIHMKNSSNITIKNFSIDFDPLPFSQGVIKDVGKDSVKYFDVYIYEGYDMDDIALNDTELFDPNTLELKKNASAIYQSYVYGRIEKLAEPRMIRIRRKKGSPDYFNETKGELVVLSRKKDPKAKGHTIYLDSNKNCLIENVILYSSPSFGFYEFGGMNTTFRSCQIKKKTNDSKVAFPRLRSGNSDGIDCRGSLSGPHIDNCTIHHNSDDCIAISGRFYVVLQEASKKLAVISYLPMDIKGGDSIKIVARDGTIRSNKVLSVVRGKSGDYSRVYDKALHAFDKINPGLYDLHYGKLVYEMTLDRETNAQIGEVVYDRNRTCSNFSITNSNLGFNRARGALIKASKGVIKNNRFESCQLPGISVAPELFYMEAGYSEDLYIAENLILNCNFGHTRGAWEQAAALTVSALNVNRQISQPGGFKNIRIEKNRILGCPKPSVILTSIYGGFFKSNQMESNTMIRYNGSAFGVKNDVEFWEINNRDFDVSLSVSEIPDITLSKSAAVSISKENSSFIITAKEKKIYSIFVSDVLGNVFFCKALSQPAESLNIPDHYFRGRRGVLILFITFEDKSVYPSKIFV